ncbi:helix-turn-helix domain-containing protein [Pseudochryseolinea flava]|nr:helix-turn-helix transcriptional regulator [Pseudochryseolinea flava]
MKRSTDNDSSFVEILEMIGENLRHFRKEKGFRSHADFAAKYKLPSIHYWRMEKGRTNMTLKSLHRVLSIHSLTLGDLFSKRMARAHQISDVASRRKRRGR